MMTTENQTDKPVKIAAIVMTLDEQPNIEECLQHLKPYVDYILVVDGGSKDQTTLLADKYADRIIVHEAKGSYCDERNYAWRQLPEEYDWSLWVDADERMHRNFLPYMREILKANPNMRAFRFPRANFPAASDFPDYQVRLLHNHSDIRWGRNPEHPVPVVEDDILVSTIPGFCGTLLDLFITHFPRRTDIKRPWWDDE
jgi:glycosyltransferase involved in cell wall biosynthesis